MQQERRAGRPHAASRELLEEAACELFLERGYAATSVADITARAGVARSTFFNYVQSKSDLLWARFDDAVAHLAAQLAAVASSDAERSPWRESVDAVRALGASLPPENVALAFAQSQTMGLGEDLRLAEARRLTAVRDAVARHLLGGGTGELAARVRATMLAGALLAAVREWSLAGAGRHDLPGVLDRALAALEVESDQTYAP